MRDLSKQAERERLNAAAWREWERQWRRLGASVRRAGRMMRLARRSWAAGVRSTQEPKCAESKGIES